MMQPWFRTQCPPCTIMIVMMLVYTWQRTWCPPCTIMMIVIIIIRTRCPPCTIMKMMIMMMQDPVSPLHGYTVLANYRGQNRPGSLATLKCNPGYELFGNKDSLCGDDGTWLSVGGEPRADRATCELVTCPHPPDVDNTHMELLNDTLTWGAVILYTCRHSDMRDVSRCHQGEYLHFNRK